MYNFKPGRCVGLPAGGCISSAEHMHLSDCILELVNVGEVYKLMLCNRKCLFLFYRGSEILKNTVSILLKECTC